MFFLYPALSAAAQTGDTRDGRHIMEEVFKRHRLFPYVYEEQTVILMDAAGNRDVRKMRRFSRVEKDGTVKYLLVFDDPAEIRGVAMLAIGKHADQASSGVYLPAFGKELKPNAGHAGGSHFLGTDFAIEDLTTDSLSDFRYTRRPDQVMDKIVCFVLDVVPKETGIERATGCSRRRHFIRQDNFFTVRTEYFDRRGRFVKCQTYHDLKRVDKDMWRANMILMVNHRQQHTSLIKIDRRIFSHDYVPPKTFTAAWILGNRHILAPTVSGAYDGGDAELSDGGDVREPRTLKPGPDF